jgi:hypothetical protein
MHLKKAAVLILFFLATAVNAHAVDFICFESTEDCKDNGPFLSVAWITAVRHAGSGEIEVWFDGWPGSGRVRWTQVDWDHFFSNVIQKHDFKKFADYYIKDQYLRRIHCALSTCELQIHPYTMRLEGAAAVAMKAYIAQQIAAGRIIVTPSKEGGRQ